VNTDKQGLKMVYNIDLDDRLLEGRERDDFLEVLKNDVYPDLYSHDVVLKKVAANILYKLSALQ
jgi:hypothetical protein